MTKKQEALDKAKQSGKNIAEGGRELGIGTAQVIGGTAGALSYTLLSSGEKLASTISKSRESAEGISTEEKEHRRNSTAKYNEKAKKHIIKAGKLGKTAVKGTGKVIKGGAKAIGNTVKGGYHLVDAGDKAIGDYFEKKQNEKGKKTGKIASFFRDNILKLLIATSAVGYGGYEGTQYVMDKNQDGKEVVIEAEDKSESNETLLIPTSGYNLLNGKKITTNAPLTRRYLGGDLEESGDIVVGDTLVLNSANSLHNLWTKKINKYGQYTKEIAQLDSIDTSSMSPEDIESFRVKYPIDATYLFVVKPYIDGKEKKEQMTLKQFIQQTNQIVKDLKSDTESYDGGLTGVKKQLFNSIKKDINGESIVAYAMTELCENKEDGEFNTELFDILLRNSGTNYLSNVPAIYDGKTSYGLYQFTEFALHDVPGDVRGASVVNKVLPKDKKIPGSVIDLKTWQDQTKAAYMFALFNLNAAVKKLDDKQAKELLSYQKHHREKFRDNMTQLIAMCHHLPVDAKALKKWHEDKHKLDIYNYGKAQTYGKASKKNYESLK